MRRTLISLACLVAASWAWADEAPAPLAERTAESKSSDEPAVQPFWSLRPLVRPAVPAVKAADRVRTPIDAFLLARLEAEDMTFSPAADKPTLLRRVTYDLIGLPPTPEDVTAFLADSAPDAYEKIVDRLLASPRYGERWARHWMDIVHFAETHGHDEDKPRENAWPYRDYLIRSFNEDKPYARFVQEQVAGDALYPDEASATIALGFLAAGPWDQSSQMGIQDGVSDKAIAQVIDRDDMIATVMSAFCSATVHCARCHNHKFDPFTQADYYSLQAVFAGVDRADRQFDADPAVRKRRLELADRRRLIESLDAQRLSKDLALTAEVAALQREFVQKRDVWKALTPVAVASANGATSKSQADGSVVFSGTRPARDTYTLTLESDLPEITAIQLEVLRDVNLPFNGPGRQDNGNLHLSEVRLSAAPAAGGEAAPLAIASASADFNQDGWTVAHAIDGDPATAWGIFPKVGESHTAVFVLREPLKSSGPVRLTVVLEQLHGGGHLIGRPRVSVTAASQPSAAAPVPVSVVAAMAVEPSSRTPQQQVELSRYLLNGKLKRDLAALPTPQTVYAATRDFKVDGNFKPPTKPRAVHVLRRGDINQPQAEAAPGALSCVAGVEARFAIADPSDEAARRAALARWLVDPNNVLAWRSIVNRVWHYHFGRGICDTPNDLGKMGGQPSHVELLDWLAVEFRDGNDGHSGGSLKRLHRLMVTSAAYKQSSQSDAERTKVDADNRLLWRMNRTRLDAECIRDSMLSIGGKLDLTMGGPSVKQFVQTPGIHITPNVDYQSFDVDSPGNFRRSIYRFLFRTLPDPFMESMDCPDASQLAPVRAQSVTALQALSMLNNRFLVRQSEHTAARLMKQSTEPPEQVRLLFQLALCRDPVADEADRWNAYAAKHGLANACRMMFNTSEFLFVN